MPYKNPDARRTAGAKWRSENPTYAKEYFAKHQPRSRDREAHRRRRVELKQTPRGRLLRLVGKARRRARDAGIPFSITADDLRMPERCPVLGIPIDLSPGAEWGSRPSLDRIKSGDGYVPGNVTVISFRTNTRKSSLTIEDLRRLLAYMEAAELLG